MTELYSGDMEEDLNLKMNGMYLQLMNMNMILILKD